MLLFLLLLKMKLPSPLWLDLEWHLKAELKTCQDCSQTHHMPRTGKLALRQNDVKSDQPRPESAISTSSCPKWQALTQNKWKLILLTRCFSPKKRQYLLSAISQWRDEAMKWVNKFYKPQQNTKDSCEEIRRFPNTNKIRN